MTKIKNKLSNEVQPSIVGDVCGSYIINRTAWCKVFDKMNKSPEIDMKGMKDCDRMAVLSWLIMNYHAPKKLKKRNYQ